VARTSADLESLAASLAGNDIKISLVAADISKRNEVEAAVAEIQQELGSIDILINNAGIAKFGSVVEMDPVQWERIMQVNLMGTYYVTRAVLPGMISQNSSADIKHGQYRVGRKSRFESR
jgi:3-oxoacyl-[acyl-carrier protein] reductase